MPSLISRWITGLIFFGIGIFWSVSVLFEMLTMTFKWVKTKSHNPLPKVVQNPKFRHDFVRTNSGMKLHCVHAGEQNKQLMLCIHGFPECWYSYHSILEYFSKTYHVVAFDMRGYGESDKPKYINDYHIDYLVCDVKELIESLGYKKAIVVAHDWGGAVAWALPYFYPDVVDKLIIMNAPHPLAFMKYMKEHKSQLRKSWYMFFFQLPYLPELYCSMNDYQFVDLCFYSDQYGIKNASNRLTLEEAGIYKHNAGKNFTYAINYYRATNAIYTGMNLKRSTKAIKQPCLIIWGRQDGALESGLAEYNKDCVPHAKVHYIEECSHWVSLDQPKECIKTIEEFLQENC